MAWKLWENGINHIDRYDESNGITDRFNGAVWTRKFSRKDTMHWNGTKQMFASCVIFSWFFWEVELATLGLIAINDIKDGIKIKRNGNYQIDGFNQINWSDGTNGTDCVRNDSTAGYVWFHWMKLSERMKCQHMNW